ncbi:MAG: IS200/IS605 family transposase [Phycisphaerales bacterium]|nr:IS200/IS605 family transposase [Phycisphaerales bacterium]
MPQSLSAVHVHVVFSTKERKAMLRDEQLRAALHAYLGGICNRLDCPPVRVGGADDHVHVLARLGRQITQAEFIKELKRASNVWLKDQSDRFATFQWQAGYAIFSVSQSNLSQVDEYIANQETHHQRVSFVDELLALLQRHSLDYDEQYIWD